MNKNLAGTKIGFIGLGNMGRPMARHLHHAGADVIVWNRSPGPVDEAVADGMTRATSLANLAKLVGDGFVCINLTNTETVQRIVFGDGGLIHALNARALVVDFGTTGVRETRNFSDRHPWVDAPVSGGQIGAEAATLSIMAGGSEANFLRALPLLQVVGKRVTHMGASGAGQVTKLANQLIVAQTIDAVAQALRLAEMSGVDAAKVREALLGGFAESRILDIHGDRMVRRDFIPGGRAELQLKDVRLVCELADDVGFKSATLSNCLAQWEFFVGVEGHGHLDHSGLYKLYE